MKQLITAIAALMAVVAMSSQAHALEFGPKFKYCDVKVSTKNGGKKNVELLLLSGATTRGTIACKGTNGKNYKSNIVIPMLGVGLGVGVCDMDVDLSIVGADLGLDLTRKNVRKIMKIADIGPIVPGKRSLAVTASADLEDIGAEVGIGNITYGKGCAHLVGLRFGYMYEEGAYDKMIKRRQEQMQTQH